MTAGEAAATHLQDIRSVREVLEEKIHGDLGTRSLFAFSATGPNPPLAVKTVSPVGARTLTARLSLGVLVCEVEQGLENGGRLRVMALGAGANVGPLKLPDSAVQPYGKKSQDLTVAECLSEDDGCQKGSHFTEDDARDMPPRAEVVRRVPTDPREFCHAS